MSLDALRIRRWGRRHAVLAVAVAAYFAVRFVEFALSIVFKDVKVALGISTFVVGVAITASTVTYAFVQLPSGALGDRFGHRAVVLASVGCTGVASLLLAAAGSGLVVVMGMALVGLVSGAYYSPATALLTDRFADAGRTIGVHRLGAQAVGLTGPLVGVLVATNGWRAALVAAGVLTAPVLVGFATVVRPRPPSNPDASLTDRLAPGRLGAILSRPPVAATTVVAGLAQFVDTATFSFLPLLLREYHGLAVETAAALFTLYFVAVASAQPVAGWLSDHVRRNAVTVGALTTAVVGFLVLAVRPSGAFVVLGVAFVGLGMGWGPPVHAQFVDHFDGSEQGTGFGLVRTVYIGFAALNGLVVGGVATAWGWRAGIGVLLAALAASVVVAVLPDDVFRGLYRGG